MLAGRPPVFTWKRGSARTSPSAGSTNSAPLPGVSKLAFTNTVGNGDFNLHLVNATTAPITVYPPVLSATDAGVGQVPVLADFTAGPPRSPCSTWITPLFADADRSARYQLELRTTLAADSVNGNNANAGTLYAPKVTLQQTMTNGSVFGLYRGSLFRDSLPIPRTTTHGHRRAGRGAGFGSRRCRSFPPSTRSTTPPHRQTNGNGTYSIQWTPQDATSSAFNQRPGYDNIYVVEINTATEGAMPIASRRRMTDVTSSAAAVSTPGSVYITSFGNGWLAQVHPSDNPSATTGAYAGTYRYEVVSRYCPANWGQADVNPGDGAMSGLELVGGNNGYGSLEGPPGFVGDRLVIVHATTHSAVIGGGSLQRSLFYESGASSIQLAWYTGGGCGALRWDTRHCIFYMNVGDRAANGVISHTGGTPLRPG